MGLITENNAHYYSGQQAYIEETGGSNISIQWVGDVVLKRTIDGVQNSNYEVFKNNLLLTESTDYNLINNESVVISSLSINDEIIIQLKASARENNYGSYSYIKLDDIINNFIVAYVGDDKLIPSIKRTDVVFHAKRGIQEFSYDTLKSIKSQELTVPLSLSVIIPQDYVNYVKISCIDEAGVKKPIYPSNNLTINPYTNPIQDNEGIPIQDSFGNNTLGASITEERWANSSGDSIDSNLNSNSDAYDILRYSGTGQRYGLSPQHTQSNGWFTMNEREGKISFSSNLADKIIVLEYISDGLSYDLDTKVPKLAEEAIYAHISCAIISSKINQPEYIVRRLKQERSAKLRNAKIRLSNIKLTEITQALRGKSKLIK